MPWCLILEVMINQVEAVRTSNNLHAPILFGCLNEWKPDIYNQRFTGFFGYEIRQILMPRDDGNVLVRQLGAKIKLWMRQDFTTDERLDDIEERGRGSECEHSSGSDFLVAEIVAPNPVRIGTGT